MKTGHLYSCMNKKWVFFIKVGGVCTEGMRLGEGKLSLQGCKPYDPERMPHLPNPLPHPGVLTDELCPEGFWRAVELTQ